MAGSIRHLRQRGGRGRATLVVILAAQILASCGSAATGTPAGATATAPATPQAAQGYAGFIGRFARTDKGGVRYAGTLWAGPVAADTVAVLLQGAAGQRPTLDADMAQVLRTIDMDAG